MVKSAKRRLVNVLSLCWIISLLLISFTSHFPLSLKRMSFIAFSITICFFLIANPYFEKKISFHKLNFCIFLISLFLLFFYFFSRFPLKDFNKITFLKDYPVFYSLTIFGFEMLKEGGLFGWNPYFLGGYYFIADTNQSLALFFLPFVIFGYKIGFHLMILTFYLLFPFLLYKFAKIYMKEIKENPFLLIFLSISSAISFFHFILLWGMIDALIGLNFFLLNLIIWSKAKFSKKYSILLGLTLGLTVYAHLPFFFYSLIYILLEIIYDRRLPFKNILICGAIAFLISLPFTYWFLKYPSYFIPDLIPYKPVKMSFSQFMIKWVKSILHRILENIKFYGWLRPYEFSRWRGIILTFLPISIFLWHQKINRRLIFYTYFTIIFAILSPPAYFLLFQRIDFLLSIFSPLLFFYFGRYGLSPLLSILCAFMFLWGGLGKYPHISDLKEYDKELIEEIEKMEGAYIVLEQRSILNLVQFGAGRSELPKNPTHFEVLFPLELRKKFLTGTIEGYHHSIYRGNVINSGTFRGKLISEYPVDTINKWLKKWGVKYLVLWSETSKKYFEKFSDFYKKIWENSEWAIFEFKNDDLNEVKVEGGKGKVLKEGYFEKIIEVEGEKGAECIIRMNYFPAWRAYCGDKRINIYNREGQIAFRLPSTGNQIICLRFPKLILTTRHFCLK